MTPNINDNHPTISSLVHQLDICHALDYDGIPGVIDMSQRLNLAAMVGCSRSRVSSAAPGSMPTTRATTSSSPPSSLLADALRKWSYQDKFGREENKDQLSLRAFQEFNGASI
ncbi:hypothetical protein RHSIM_Rhsim01G0155100 [Rhododendron simsii]|uniref:Uncharacterized protein n=1 Tax=Rhododendron simsii TaxID=118357 RepID=A0A834LWC6_RHOSS|nr:hypothetical protein RHSIM_Rhsim01G0155100 [Rhododendron simsii]